MTDLRVLIADDEQSVLDLVSRFLQSAGVPKDHQTILPSCAAAIEHYKKDPNYHLVVTDLNQSPSGADVVEFVRNHHGDLDTRVAVMTGGNAPPDVLDRAQRLTDFFIEKPFTLSHTLEIIKSTNSFGSNSTLYFPQTKKIFSPLTSSLGLSQMSFFIVLAFLQIISCFFSSGEIPSRTLLSIFSLMYLH